MKLNISIKDQRAGEQESRRAGKIDY